MITILYINIYKIHFTRNTSSNLLMYSTNFKTTDGFNAILTHFIYLQSTFYTSIEVHSMIMTQRDGSKHVGVLVFQL